MRMIPFPPILFALNSIFEFFISKEKVGLENRFCFLCPNMRLSSAFAAAVSQYATVICICCRIATPRYDLHLLFGHFFGHNNLAMKVMIASAGC